MANIEITESLDLNEPRVNTVSEENLHKIHNNFREILKIQLSKGKYKKVIKDIKSKENIYSDFINSKEIRVLKIRTMLKIVRKKLNKLATKHYNPLEERMRTRSIEDWLHKIDSDLQSILRHYSFCKIIHEETEKFIELITQLTLEELYLWAEFTKFDKKYQDCVAYLGLCDLIINSFIEFSKDPKTVNIAQKCYLFISSMLIADSDYDNALHYQMSCLKLSFRELFLRVDVLEGFNYEKLTEKRKHYFHKIFLNIVIAFYQRGVCQEDLGDIVKAIESYRQGRFFADKFLKYEFHEIYEFIQSVEKRANSYYSIINNLRNKSREEIPIKEEHDSLFTKKKNLIKSTRNSLIPLEKNIEDNLNITENIKNYELNFYPNEKKGEKINYFLSTVNIIDSLLSEKFRDILEDMRDLNISNLDSVTIERIQNRINEIRNEKNRITSSNINKSDNLTLTPRTNLKNAHLHTSRKSHLRNYSSKSNLSNFNDNTFNISRSKLKIRNLSGSNSSTINQMNIVNSSNNFLFPKFQTALKENDYVYDKYVFSHNIKNKIHILEDYENKELNFQKQLLNLKQTQKFPAIDGDKNIKRKCEEIFNRAISSNLSSYKQNDDKNKKNRKLSQTTIDEIKIDHKHKLETCVIMSLNSSKFDEFKNSLTNGKRPLVKNFSIPSKMSDSNSNILNDNKSVDRHNTKQFYKISQEIESIEKSEKFYDESFNSNPINLKKSSSTRHKTVKQKRNMDYFVKIQGSNNSNK